MSALSTLCVVTYRPSPVQLPHLNGCGTSHTHSDSPATTLGFRVDKIEAEGTEVLQEKLGKSKRGFEKKIR